MTTFKLPVSKKRTSQPCDRCHSDWPQDRMFSQKGKKYCGLCWRVLIYPRKVGEVVEEAIKLSRLERQDKSQLTRDLLEDPTPHPWQSPSV